MYRGVPSHHSDVDAFTSPTLNQLTSPSIYRKKTDHANYATLRFLQDTKERKVCEVILASGVFIYNTGLKQTWEIGRFNMTQRR